jgi:hypothetical protein
VRFTTSSIVVTGASVAGLTDAAFANASEESDGDAVAAISFGETLGAADFWDSLCCAAAVNEIATTTTTRMPLENAMDPRFFLPILAAFVWFCPVLHCQFKKHVNHRR